MKIFIVAPEHINKLDIANEIVALNDDLNICKTFTNIGGIITENVFELDIDDIILSFKNNALLFLQYSEEIIKGITLDDYNSSDIITLNTEHFNMINDEPFINDEILIVWLDSKEKSEQHSKDIIESKYLQERIDNFNIPFLYFCDENKKDIAKIVLSYLLADDETREEIQQENS